MTAEPRDAAAIILDHREALADALGRLAAADRENAELRNSLEACRNAGANNLHDRLEAVQALCSSFSAHTFTVDGRLVVETEPVLAALSAAPQPEHADDCPGCTSGTDDHDVRYWNQPSASDEPARCELHALTEYGTTNCPVEGVRANIDDGECSACGATVGPAASGTPDGGL